MLETVIPKAPNATVMIVGGTRKGQVRQLMLKLTDKLETTSAKQYLTKNMNIELVKIVAFINC